MKFKSLLVLTLIFVTSVAHAQSVTDSRVWTKLTYRIEPTKKLNLDVSGLYRNVGGEEGMDRWITELQLTSKQTNSLKFAVEARHYAIFDTEGLSQGIDHRVRLRVQSTKTYDLGRDEFSMRYGIQHREVITGGGSARTDMRVRAAYSKNFKDWKWDPVVFTELIESVYGNQSRRVRWGAETGNKLLGGNVSVGYFYQHNFSFSSPHFHTFTLGYRL